MNPYLTVKRPVRFPRTRLVQPVHLERAARIAAANITGPGAILLVIDADEDCAATKGSELSQQLSAILPGYTCRVALAVREFESWIVGADPEYGVTDPDAAGDLKARIRDRYGVYSETADQSRLIATADLALLERNSRSFQHLKGIVDAFEVQGRFN